MTKCTVCPTTARHLAYYPAPERDYWLCPDCWSALLRVRIQRVLDFEYVGPELFSTKEAARKENAPLSLTSEASM